MLRGIEQLHENSDKNIKELVTQEKTSDLLLSFQNNCFDEKWVLTDDWLNILIDVKNLCDSNLEMFNKVSRDFEKSLINFKWGENNNEVIPWKDILVERWLEAQFSYIDSNKLNNWNEVKSIDELNNFSKMRLVNLYETFEWNKEMKHKFILAIMNNDKWLYENNDFRLVLNDIKTQVPLFQANHYASLDWWVFQEVNKESLYNEISSFLTKIWNWIKNILDSWVKTIKEVWTYWIWLWWTTLELIEWIFEDWDLKEKQLIEKFDKDYNVLTKWFKHWENKETWFTWMLIENKENPNELSLLIRWSDDWEDWLSNNIQFAIKNKLPPQIEDLVLFIEEIKSKWLLNWWRKIKIVWHSLWWWLGQIISLMYKWWKDDIISNSYTFNSPWVSWINPEINSNNQIVQNKIDKYKKNLLDPLFDKKFILNTRNNDIVWNFNDDEHIWVKSEKIDWYSHFMEPLSIWMWELNKEQFKEKFGNWFDKNIEKYNKDITKEIIPK